MQGKGNRLHFHKARGSAFLEGNDQRVVGGFVLESEPGHLDATLVVFRAIFKLNSSYQNRVLEDELKLVVLQMRFPQHQAIRVSVLRELGGFGGQESVMALWYVLAERVEK